MPVKKILKEYGKEEIKQKEKAKRENKSGTEKLEILLVQLNRCFVDSILPSVFDVENDISEAGFWSQLDIGQSSALSSGKPNLKQVTLYFYPERISNYVEKQPSLNTVYQVNFKPTEDLRKIVFSIHKPGKLSAMDFSEKKEMKIDQIDSKAVDRFLEKFVMGTFEDYNSDRLFR